MGIAAPLVHRRRRRRASIARRRAPSTTCKDIDVEFPLQRLVCVTGVSGSGKSTLVQDVLLPGAARALRQADRDAGRARRALLGADHAERRRVRRPVADRQDDALQPGELRRRLRRDPRALRATRRWRKQRGYTAGTFSFNSGNGRCPTCGGNGFEHVEMQFLSDVYLRCPDCDGTRYRAEVLEVSIERWRPTRPQRRRRARADRRARRCSCSPTTARCCARCSRIVDVGLEYVKLGQPVPTLSGGEAQRLKLAGYLAEAARQRHLEPPGAGRDDKRHACSCSTSRPPACTSTTSPS